MIDTTIAKNNGNPMTPVLIESLADPACYGHPVGTVRVIETHISYVLLTGDYAYKIKKPLDLGFLDFSTLEKRRFYCEEEMRLNRRLAPQIYLNVVPISGPINSPQVDGRGPAVEFAVKMRQFSTDEMLDLLLRQNCFPLQRMDELAAIVAGFHLMLEPDGTGGPYGSFGIIRDFAIQNFDQIDAVGVDSGDAGPLSALREWTERELEGLQAVFQARKANGYIRECHGDLHLGNLTLIDNKIVVFDCIEFNPDLR